MKRTYTVTFTLDNEPPEGDDPSDLPNEDEMGQLIATVQDEPPAWMPEIQPPKVSG